MKNILTIIGVFLVTAGAAFAQTNNRGIEATDIRMFHTNGSVNVSFTLHAGSKVTKANHDLVISPVLERFSSRKQLPSIIIRGRHTRAVDDGRGEQTSEYMQPGGSLQYTATVPYEEWMRGGRLIFEGVSVGCSSTEVILGPVANNILNAAPQIETKVVGIPTVTVRTTGEQLAEQYPFVAPASEFELLRQVLEQSSSTFDDGRSEISQRIIAETRQGSISIFFGQGGRMIDSNFGDNGRNLVELISAVRALATANDTGIAAIVIAGFASPEGSVELNDRLAWDRAVAVKTFLTGNTDVDPRNVKIYNGGVDWTGLRELVSGSDMYRKQRITEIIDNTPVWDSARGVGRLGELMRLDGGEPYRQMVEEFFPKLRQAAYIKVYYEDKTN